MKRIGLALGGGGAKGLAHIPMLEVFDELGVVPCRIAGTSIGAVMGALYASGVKGGKIRELVDHMIHVRDKTSREALKILEFIDLDFRQHGGLIKGDRLIQFLYDAMGVSTFEELKIPLSVVTTDFWESEQVVLSTGELLPAVKASMGLPGVFTPVLLGGRVLIDGGGVNPLPHDLLVGDCDVVVAVDVMGEIVGDRGRTPNLFRAVGGMFDIMQRSIMGEKLKRFPPDIYIRPGIKDVDLLEFHKIETVYAQAERARVQLREALLRVL